MKTLFLLFSFNIHGVLELKNENPINRCQWLPDSEKKIVYLALLARIFNLCNESALEDATEYRSLNESDI